MSSSLADADFTAVPFNNNGIDLPPQLGNIIKEAYSTEEDVEETADMTKMVNAVQKRAKTELASYMRVSCMRLGLI